MCSAAPPGLVIETVRTGEVVLSAAVRTIGFGLTIANGFGLAVTVNGNGTGPTPMVAAATARSSMPPPGVGLYGTT